MGDKGYDLLYFTNKQWDESWVDYSYKEKCANRNVDGVIMMGYGKVNIAQFDRLLNSDIPSVFIDLDLVGSNTSYVTSDNTGGAKKATAKKSTAKKSSTKKKVGEAKEATKEQMKKAQEVAEKEIQNLRGKYQQAEKKARAYAKNNPEKASIIAASVGAAVGAGLTTALHSLRKKK